jgi:hypothetical protein
LLAFHNCEMPMYKLSETEHITLSLVMP